MSLGATAWQSTGATPATSCQLGAARLNVGFNKSLGERLRAGLVLMMPLQVDDRAIAGDGERLVEQHSMEPAGARQQLFTFLLHLYTPHAPPIITYRQLSLITFCELQWIIHRSHFSLFGLLGEVRQMEWWVWRQSEKTAWNQGAVMLLSYIINRARQLVTIATFNINAVLFLPGGKHCNLLVERRGGWPPSIYVNRKVILIVFPHFYQP